MDRGCLEWLAVTTVTIDLDVFQPMRIESEFTFALGTHLERKRSSSLTWAFQTIQTRQFRLWPLRSGDARSSSSPIHVRTLPICRVTLGLCLSSISDVLLFL